MLYMPIKAMAVLSEIVAASALLALAATQVAPGVGGTVALGHKLSGSVFGLDRVATCAELSAASATASLIFV